jgi:hypothetical protein
MLARGMPFAVLSETVSSGVWGNEKRPFRCWSNQRISQIAVW